jgi:hypothetical protein
MAGTISRLRHGTFGTTQDKPLSSAKVTAKRPVVNSGHCLERDFYSAVTSRVGSGRSAAFVTCCNVRAVLYVVLGRPAAAASLAAGLLRDGHDALTSAAAPPGPAAGPARALPLRECLAAGTAGTGRDGLPGTPDILGALWAGGRAPPC